MLSLLATLHTPRPGLIGTASVTATVIIAFLAIALRFAPVHLRERLTFIAPYVLLFMILASSLDVRLADIHHRVATIIYLASAFGFATHNFQIPKRAHYINGVVWGFLTGLLLTFICSSWAFRLGQVVIHNNFGFWTAHVAFVVCWGLVCLVVYRRQRSPRHAKDSGQSEGTER
jgi:hypothetical protein